MARVAGPLFSIDATGTFAGTIVYKPDLIKQRIALAMKGKVGQEVIQGVAPGLGNVLTDPTRRTMVRRHIIPTDMRTPAQLARRAAHATATAMWHSLHPDGKAWWNTIGVAKQQTGYTAFLSHVLRDAKSHYGAVWDSGESHWDSGASIWDIVIGSP